MMTEQSAHTPGPWRAGISFFSGCVMCEGSPRPLATGLRGPDALLIAAAPDMLEALQGLLRAVDALMPTDGPLKIAARAAIAKALGK